MVRTFSKQQDLRRLLPSNEFSKDLLTSGEGLYSLKQHLFSKRAASFESYFRQLDLKTARQFKHAFVQIHAIKSRREKIKYRNS